MWVGSKDSVSLPHPVFTIVVLESKGLKSWKKCERNFPPLGTTREPGPRVKRTNQHLVTLDRSLTTPTSIFSSVEWDPLLILSSKVPLYVSAGRRSLWENSSSSGVYTVPVSSGDGSMREDKGWESWVGSPTLLVPGSSETIDLMLRSSDDTPVHWYTEDLLTTPGFHLPLVSSLPLS